MNYTRLLQKANLHNFTIKGLVSNSLSFSTILTSAELTQQLLEKHADEKKKRQWDVNTDSLKRYGFLGGFCIAPMLYTYYCWLDKTFPGRTALTVAKKVANDVLFANVAYYSVFYYGMNFLEHKNHEQAKMEVQKAFKFSYFAGMIYWVPVMSCNFYFVSPKFRVLFIAFASFVEMNGLCLMRRFHGKSAES